MSPISSVRSVRPAVGWYSADSLEEPDLIGSHSSSWYYPEHLRKDGAPDNRFNLRLGGSYFQCMFLFGYMSSGKVVTHGTRCVYKHTTNFRDPSDVFNSIHGDQFVQNFNKPFLGYGVLVRCGFRFPLRRWSSGRLYPIAVNGRYKRNRHVQEESIRAVIKLGPYALPTHPWEWSLDIPSYYEWGHRWDGFKDGSVG